VSRLWSSLYRLWLGFVRRLMFLWVRTRVITAPGFDAERLGEAVCFVLERPGLTDEAVLDQECLEAGRTPPSAGLHVAGLAESSAIVTLRRGGRRLFRRSTGASLPRLERIVRAVANGEPEDVTLVPVSIFWGRAPEKEGSTLKLLLSENWEITGRVKRFFQVVLNGRDVLVHISAPVSVRERLSEGLEPARTVRKIARVIRVHFRRQREVTIGPDLSHRRTLVDEILRSQSVEAAIRREAEVNKVSPEEARERARRYAYEISADFSPAVIRILERVLTRLWDRLYEGVEIGHLDRLKGVAEGNEIVYVPCHRSHIDYLLLSYVVYRNGLACPHIAAGLNLNLPVVGPILRRGGAFFLRRSFRDNPLYAAVFNKYLSLNLAKGVPIEYFIEGGRSRTGRLRPPRAGMLSMTVRSFVRNPVRPLVFMPVYFGYERLIEGNSYLSELAGEAKERETLFGLVRGLKVLRGRFGKVYVNFGEPIALERLLDEARPGWREEPHGADERPAWIQGVVRGLGIRILTDINAVAAVNPVGLLATVLLSTPKRSILETDLLRMLELHLALLDGAPYAPGVTRSGMSARQVIDYGEQFGLLSRQPQKLGDILYFEEKTAILASYFRNNVAHIMALPSLLACAFNDRAELPAAALRATAGTVYPYVRGELFIRWSEDELPAAIDTVIDVLLDRGLLERSDDGEMLRRPPANTSEAVQLSVLGQLALQMLERYYVTIALLLKHGSGTLTPKRLETLGQLMAERISLLYQFNAPEFFDRALFRSFIGQLRFHEVIGTDESGRIVFDDTLRRVDEQARLMLGERFRHDVLRAVHQ
jgi:glycerol-3-phosphate O-acyltransferase